MNNLTIKPVVTEKSLRLAGNSKFTFAISKGVNKIIIAKVIADRYKVEVEDVNLVKTPGKPKNKLTKKKGMTKPKTKAIVTLKKGQTIPGFELAPAADNKEEEKPKSNKK